MEFLEEHLTHLLEWPINRRNQFVDRLFYDVGALNADEQARLSPLIDREGTILVVSPQAAKRPDRIRHYKSALRFMVKEGDTVRAVAVAGVGSSALGTAALARNVADFCGVDVAGIVTGHGVADVLAEALGGWIFQWEIARLRHKMQLVTENLLTALREAHAVGPEAKARKLFGLPIDSWFTVAANSDVGTLLDILLASRSLRLLVGHSKGNLLISFALHHMVREVGQVKHPYYDELAVVTLGAVVDVPREFRRVHQYLGQLDFLGTVNSDFRAPHEPPIPRTGHHLNPRLACALSVSDVLRKVPGLGDN